MNSEKISLIALDRFVREFVFAIIRNIREKNFSYEERQVIHADLVPIVSPKVFEKVSEVKKDIASIPSITESEKPKVVVPKIVVKPVVPQKKFVPRLNVVVPKPIISVPKPIAPTENIVLGGFGRIEPLLHDPSVLVIECQGEGKPVMVVKFGQKQMTKIILSKKEIDGILDEFSDRSHIPVMEGVFRVAVDGLSVSAVVSEIVGTKFVIRKAMGVS